MSASILRNKIPFRRTVAAIGANQLSEAMSYITIPLLVLALTNSVELSSLTIFLVNISGIIFNIFSGVIVDKGSPCKTLAFSCIAQSVMWGIVSVLILNNIKSIFIMIFSLITIAIVSQLDYPSENSIIVDTVPQESLGEASALGQARESAANIIGGPLAGFISGISIFLAVFLQSIINLVAFFVSPKRSKKQQDCYKNTEDSILLDFRKGYTYILKRKTLIAITMVGCIANFSTTGIPLVFIYYYNSIGISTLQIGVFASSFGIGVIVGSLIVGYLTQKYTLSLLGSIAIFAVFIGQVCVSITYSNFWLTCIVFIASGVPLPSLNASIVSYVNASTPSDIIGRVHSAMGIPNMILMPLGSLFAGFLFIYLGVQLSVLFFSIFTFISLFFMLSQKNLRTIPNIKDVEKYYD